MYTVTFYSFKGGVGRTMALMNTAVALAQTGRRVLVVDFDLEAPGVESFSLPGLTGRHPGVIEFVEQYLATNESPRVEDYVYSLPDIAGEGGALHIMPSGIQDSSYGSRLNRLSWSELYNERDGYLLFEDLREQWKRSLGVDYVLIDSRTGHTDVGGICTRQLPDAVVVLFFPTEQNLIGLTKVVSDIRSEKRTDKKRPIDLHFVTSNVPDLDDEDRILDARLEAFRTDLGYKSLSATIHHYNSLALLNQAVFVRERPRSRLAHEYQALLRAIRTRNPEDEQGALIFLDEYRRNSYFWDERGSEAPEEHETTLRAILENHPQNARIVYRIAVIRERQGRLDEALPLFQQAIEAGYCEAPAFVKKAELLLLRQRESEALEDLRRALQLDTIRYPDIQRIVQLLSELEWENARELPLVEAIRKLPAKERISAADLLAWRSEALALSTVILEPMLASEDETLMRDARRSLVLAYVGLGRFEDAVGLFGDNPTLHELDIQDLFNYSMAVWAAKGLAPRQYLREVVARDEEGGFGSPNYAQCLSLVLWLVGDHAGARERLQLARQRLEIMPGQAFSCWRYRLASIAEFLRDLNEMEAAFERGEVEPEFISRTALL